MLAMSTKRRRVVITMQKKLEAIHRMDKGDSVRDIAVECGVGMSTVRSWKKTRDEIEAFCAKMITKKALWDRGTAKQCKDPSLDEALFLWFTQEKEHGMPVTGPIIQEKALSLNEQMGGDPSFRASHGWLQRWKRRHGVRLLTSAGKNLAVDNSAEDFVKETRDLLMTMNLTSEQVYNAEETCLYYKMLPDKVMAVKPESNTVLERYDERITLLACNNASGSHKLPLTIIGKSADSDTNFSSLPVLYKVERNARMNGQIFSDWFYSHFVPEVSTYLKARGLPVRAVLLVDNVHSQLPLCSGDIQVKYFPTVAAPLLKPINQGTVDSMKCQYRKQLLSLLLERGGRDSSVIPILNAIDIKDAMLLSATAWNLVSQSVILRSWKRMWPEEGNFEDVSLKEEEDIGASDFVEMFRILEGCEDIVEEDVINWLNCDEDTSHRIMTDEEIIAACISQQAITKDESNDDPNVLHDTVYPDDHNCESYSTYPNASGYTSVQNYAGEPIHPDVKNYRDEMKAHTITHTEATAMFDELLRYLEVQEETSPADVMCVQHLRERALKKRDKIRTIPTNK